jgi:hypothetical protein
MRAEGQFTSQNNKLEELRFVGNRNGLLPRGAGVAGGEPFDLARKGGRWNAVSSGWRGAPPDYGSGSGIHFRTTPLGLTFIGKMCERFGHIRRGRP